MKKLLRITTWIALCLLVLLALTFVGLLLYKGHLKKSTQIETPNGISSLEEIMLGNQEQWIFIRGENRQNPLLLFLHGGPGEPLAGIPGSRKYDQGLLNHFTVVHWDQRGAGKSYDKDIPIETMTLDSLVEDCNELIDHLRNRFNKQKVFLAAHSGGTPIGVKTAHRYPEKVHAYVGVSQIVNDYEQQKLSYEFVVKEAQRLGDTRIQRAIKAIGPPPYEYPKEIYKKARYILQYGGLVHQNPKKRIMSLMMDYLTSPEYSWSEGYNTVTRKGLNFTTNSRWEEIKAFDLSKEVPAIEVPVYFIMGKHDQITQVAIVENFYNDLEAKRGKHLIVFENSAHMPMLEENEKYHNILINVVLEESQSF